MGKVLAALAAQTLIREWHCDRILNAGVCGALVGEAGLTPGNIFRISAASEGPSGPGVPVDAIRCTGDFWQNLPAARLVTVEQPVFEAAERQRLATWGELVDMEGAVVARVAQLYGIPWDMIKGITDTADDGERINLHRNLADGQRGCRRAFEQRDIDLCHARTPKPSALRHHLQLTSGNPAVYQDRAHGFQPAVGFCRCMDRYPGVKHLPWRCCCWYCCAAVGARVFGMSFNRIFDRKIDAFEPQNRRPGTPR